MTDPLLDYLNLQTSDDYVLINDILKTHNKYSSKSSKQLQQYLSNLVNDGKIEIKDKAHRRLGLHTLLNATDYQNTMTDLDNWFVHARITEKGKDQLQSGNKVWYDTINARRQYEDYPQTRQRALWAFRISILAIVVTIILGLLKLKCN
jgi:hypothetical protein